MLPLNEITELNDIDKLPCAACFTDDSGKILFVNKAFRKLTSIQECADRNLENFLTTASKVFLQTHIWPLLRRNGKVEEIFLKIANQPNEPIPVIVNCEGTALNDDVQYCWVLFETKERANFERKLIESRNQTQEANAQLAISKKQLARANTNLVLINGELERFARTVSHDLKAPLITITAFTEGVLKEAKQVLDAKQIMRLERVVFNAKILNKMIGEILRISKISTMHIEKTAVDTKTLIKNQLKTLEAPLKKANGIVVFEGELPSIVGNESLIQQCVANLLSNTIKYADNSRDLIVTITSQTQSNFDCLEFSDNGIGIDDKHLDKIFDLFEHINSAEGTGVGLSIVKAVMDKHEGSVSVASKLGEGSTFTLNFPKMTSMSK